MDSINKGEIIVDKNTIYQDKWQTGILSQYGVNRRRDIMMIEVGGFKMMAGYEVAAVASAGLWGSRKTLLPYQFQKILQELPELLDSRIVYELKVPIYPNAAASHVFFSPFQCCYFLSEAGGDNAKPLADFLYGSGALEEFRKIVAKGVSYERN